MKGWVHRHVHTANPKIHPACDGPIHRGWHHHFGSVTMVTIASLSLLNISHTPFPTFFLPAVFLFSYLSRSPLSPHLSLSVSILSLCYLPLPPFSVSFLSNMSLPLSYCFPSSLSLRLPVYEVEQSVMEETESSRQNSSLAEWNAMTFQRLYWDKTDRTVKTVSGLATRSHWDQTESKQGYERERQTSSNSRQREKFQNRSVWKTIK